MFPLSLRFLIYVFLCFILNHLTVTPPVAGQYFQAKNVFVILFGLAKALHMYFPRNLSPNPDSNLFSESMYNPYTLSDNFTYFTSTALQPVIGLCPFENVNPPQSIACYTLPIPYS